MFVAIFEVLLNLGGELVARQELDHLPVRLALMVGGVIAAATVATAIIVLLALVEGIARGVAA